MYVYADVGTVGRDVHVEAKPTLCVISQEPPNYEIESLAETEPALQGQVLFSTGAHM